MTKRAWCVVGVIGTAGCDGSRITGEIDGREPTALQSGFWYPYEQDGDRRVAGVLADFPNACAVLSERRRREAQELESFQQSGDRDEYVEELKQIERDIVPEEYWLYTWTVEEDIATFDLDDPNEATLNILHKDGYTDWGAVLGGTPDGTAEMYTADQGTIEIRSMEDGSWLRADIIAELEDAEGQDAGEIEGSFKELSCDTLAKPVGSQDTGSQDTNSPDDSGPIDSNPDDSGPIDSNPDDSSPDSDPPAELIIYGRWDDACTYRLTLTNADTSATWVFGLAETGAGASGWYGEDGRTADSTHPASATGLTLSSVHPDCGGGGIDDIRFGHSTLFMEDFDPTITYVLGAMDRSGNALGCWTWGDDVSYYSTCTAI